MKKPFASFKMLVIACLLSILVMTGCGETAGNSATAVSPTPSPAASTTAAPVATTLAATTAPATTLAATTAPVTTAPATTAITQNSPAALAPAPPASQVTYHFDPSFSAVEQDQTRRGIDLAQKAFGPVGPFTVEAGSNVNTPSSGEMFAQASPGEITIFSRGQPWLDASDYDRVSTLVHEYFHLVQYHLTNLGDDAESVGDILPEGPLWFSEGTAEYLSYQVVARNGLVQYDKIRKEKIASAQEYTYKLKDIETDGSKTTSESGEYVLGFLAVEYLVNNHGGEQAIINYYKEIGKGADWKTAFNKSFGISIVSFYPKFEDYRKDLLSKSGS
ncbi:MAG: hypothetical protein JWP00_1260 [Chloroflexi bacterium]|nr:hypothetical protein [Chloroflexota bacterium]